jgi:hypothetical protein
MCTAAKRDPTTWNDGNYAASPACAAIGETYASLNTNRIVGISRTQVEPRSRNADDPSHLPGSSERKQQSTLWKRVSPCTPLDGKSAKLAGLKFLTPRAKRLSLTRALSLSTRAVKRAPRHPKSTSPVCAPLRNLESGLTDVQSKHTLRCAVGRAASMNLIG